MGPQINFAYKAAGANPAPVTDSVNTLTKVRVKPTMRFYSYCFNILKTKPARLIEIIIDHF